MKTKILIVFFLWCFTLSLEGQEFKIPETRRIKLQKEDSLICFEILPLVSEIKRPADLYYYWYGSNRIFCNRGGWDGHLLHGKYCCFLFGRLIEQGYFQYGLKSGEWKRWYPNGNLYFRENWKKGVLKEKFLHLPEDRIVVKTTYRKGVIRRADTLRVSGSNRLYILKKEKNEKDKR